VRARKLLHWHACACTYVCMCVCACVYICICVCVHVCRLQRADLCSAGACLLVQSELTLLLYASAPIKNPTGLSGGPHTQNQILSRKSPCADQTCSTAQLNKLASVLLLSCRPPSKQKDTPHTSKASKRVPTLRPSSRRLEQEQITCDKRLFKI
jgi:hypothetical protein